MPDLELQVFKDPEVRSSFYEMLQGGTNAYIQSAKIAIMGNPQLLQCTGESLVKAALRSASLGLSLDPIARQAFLIPRNTKVKAQPAKNGQPATPEHYEMQAYFQPHYHGLYDLAVRTNKYHYITVNPIYAGENVFENVQTGLHVYEPAGGTVLLMPDKGHPNGLHTGYRKVTDGRGDAQIVGYLGYFKTTRGFEKSVWMTLKEIHDHAKKYAPENYNSQTVAWKDKKKLPTMEMKTVFIALSKFMDLSGAEMNVLRRAIESDADENDVIEAEVNQPEPAESETIPPAMTYEQAREVLTPKGAKFGTLAADQLSQILTHDKSTPEMREAAQVILNDMKQEGA